MISETTTIAAPGGPMTAYIARPSMGGPKPAVIVLEGVYGFDDEIRRMTGLLGAAGYVGIAIDYLRGKGVPEGFNSATVCDDIAAARDWLNERDYVQHGRIGTWGFGIGGAVAFMVARLPGVHASISFYGQSIAKGLPDGGDAPIKDAEMLRAPLLLIFGGADELVTLDDIRRITTRLDAAGKKYEIEVYPNVGHSFFRQDHGTIATREIADAWDRVQAYLGRLLSA
jgi:carboxymethylenebutenolidase